MKMRLLLLCTSLALLSGASLNAAEKERPLLRDFLGLCVHTVQFKPDLYSPVTRVVRDYHPLKWDLGGETSFTTTFPFARNRVDWSKVYGSWKTAGYHTSTSLLFDDIDPKSWQNVANDAFVYGKAFASYFGPSGHSLVEAAEVGNEPGKYDDATYRTLFESMARGLREGDPRLRIATCAIDLGKSGPYAKSLDTVKGLETLYDIINIHIYPDVEGWPTWRRSFPEDPQIEFRRKLEAVLKWRKKHAPEKEVWLTEFGYDASTKPAPTTGTFAKWKGITDEQQAMWIVRAFLLLAASEVDRAYLYFFNDSDQPQVHGSSGLTRNFVPKPSFHAVAHLQRTLGEFRLKQVLSEDIDKGYVYEWAHGSDPLRRVTVVWSPAGKDVRVSLPIPQSAFVRAERMPLSAGEPESVPVDTDGSARIAVPAGERPIYVFWTAR